MTSAVLVARGKVAITEILTDLMVKLCIGSSLLSLLSHCWLRQKNASPTVLVDRAGCMLSLQDPPKYVLFFFFFVSFPCLSRYSWGKERVLQAL